MTPLAWHALTVLIVAAAVNQSIEAIGRVLAWLGQLLQANWSERD